jgi:protein-tyrosine phosphatase
MLRWVIENKLARGRRPGYVGEHGTPVPKSEVEHWINEVKMFGVRSIICLLANDQLKWYADLPTDLISFYRTAGFAVAHIPACDHRTPPLTDQHLEKIWEAYQTLPKPVLVHCSAGIDRTGLAVEYITRRLELTGDRRGRC